MDQLKYVTAGFLLPHPPVIIPEVGKGQESKAAVTIAALEKVSEQVNSLKPETVVLISPHAPMYKDYVFIYDSDELKGSLRQFGADTCKSFEQDHELRQKIEDNLNTNKIPAGSIKNADQSLDHGAMVPLLSISSKYADFKLVVLSPSGFAVNRLYLMGKLIAKAAESLGRRIIIAASGDMSHKVNGESPYGACREGSEFDAYVVDALSKGDLSSLMRVDNQIREKAAECGYRPLIILSGAFDSVQVITQVLSYEAPFGIGYCTASVYPYSKQESIHVRIARETLETKIKSGTKTTVEKLRTLYEIDQELLDRPAGVFVSLKMMGQLRGCIGTIFPVTDCIANEIIQNAIEAGTNDPRFMPVSENELPRLKYSVDVLSTPEPVASKDELDPSVFGVIVEKGWRKGLLLPDLEGVDTVDEQLRIACMKAGLDPHDRYNIRKFTVTRYE